MPWKDVSPMDQKMQFVSLAATGRFTVSQLCEDFDISRKTGHKWLNRYARQGAKGLAELSRRPQGCSHQSAEAVVALIIKERKIHPTWGPKKLYEILRCKHGWQPKECIRLMIRIWVYLCPPAVKKSIRGSGGFGVWVQVEITVIKAASRSSCFENRDPIDGF